MTGLDERAVTRETREIDSTRGGRRPLVVRLDVGGKLLRIKPKGTRLWLTVTYADVYRLAVQAYAADYKAHCARQRAARKAARV